MTEPSDLIEMLIVGAGAQACALPVSAVSEIMRPLPIGKIAGAPDFVRGLAMIRGEPVPVVDASLVLGAGGSFEPARFVVTRAGGRAVALAVTAVFGVRKLDTTVMRAAPPLLRDARPDLIDTMATLDRELLLVLRGGRLLPESLRYPIESGASDR